MIETTETHIEEAWTVGIAGKKPSPLGARIPGEIPSDQESEPESSNSPDSFSDIYSSDAQSNADVNEEGINEWAAFDESEILLCDIIEIESDIDDSSQMNYPELPPIALEESWFESEAWYQMKEFFWLLVQAAKYLV